jgi:hypothetical protein
VAPLLVTRSVSCIEQAATSTGFREGCLSHLKWSPEYSHFSLRRYCTALSSLTTSSFLELRLLLPLAQAPALAPAPAPALAPAQAIPADDVISVPSTKKMMRDKHDLPVM